MSGHVLPHTQLDDTGGVGRWKDADSKDGQGPVKAACLSCRQKKAKCDGVQPSCGQCSRKQIECIYIKSKRGGARKKRVANPPAPIVEFLKRLDSLLSVPNFGLQHAEPQEGDDPTNVVRTFASNEEVLRCYYNEVHPYLPIQPPRHYLVDVLPTLLTPESPFLLAAQTIMTLIPHTLDPSPKSASSKRLRSAASASLGKKTMAAIERQLAVAPHLECVQALTLLAVWEWGSTNDAEAAIARYSQAVQIAMAMGMHDLDKDTPKDAKGNGYALEGINWRKDALRRTWWLLYCYQITASLVSGIPAPVGTDDPRIKVDFPVCSDKDRTWSTWINCIRECYRIVGLVNQIVFSVPPDSDAPGLNSWASPGEPGELKEKQRQMLFIDKEINELMKQAERMSIIEHVPGGEDEVAKNQQSACRFALAVANIHLHRWTAFPEVSFFSKRICGFPKGEDDDEIDSPSQLSAGSGAGVSQGQTSPADPNPLSTQQRQVSYNSAPPPPLIPDPGYAANNMAQYPVPQATVPTPNNIQSAPANIGTAPQSMPGAGGGYGDDMYHVDQMMANFSVNHHQPPPPQQQQQQHQQQHQPAYATTSQQQFNNYGAPPQQQQQQFNASPQSQTFSSPTSQQYVATPAQFAPTPQSMVSTPFTPNSQPQYPTPAPQPQQQYSAPQQHQQYMPGAYPGQQQQPQQQQQQQQYYPQQQQFTPNAQQTFNASPQSSTLQTYASPPGNMAMQPLQNQNSYTPPYPSQQMALQVQPGPSTISPVWNSNVMEWQQNQQLYDGVIQDMWDPNSFPTYLPQPWFAQNNGAMQLFTSGENQLAQSYPAFELPPEMAPVHDMAVGAPSGSGSAGGPGSLGGFRKHKAWGVDDKGDPDVQAAEEAAEAKQSEAFPPGFSLARCATAAHTIVRLEILHRSAAMAADDGIPRWIPFCSCGLVSGAYAFLLLILAVEAQNGYTDESRQQVEDLFTNVKIILAGLEAYGVMWEGINMMATEVRSAIDYASNLASEVRSQRSNASSPSVPSSLPSV